MADNIKKAILKAKIDGVLTEILVKASAENITVDAEGTSLSSKLADILASLALKADTSTMNTELGKKADKTEITDMATQTWVGQQGFLKSANLNGYATEEYVDSAIEDLAEESWVTTQITNAINGLIDGADQAYDTLKEISEYILTHKDEYEALEALVGGKVSAETFNALQARVAALETWKTGDFATWKSSVDSQLSGLASDETVTNLGKKVEALETWKGTAGDLYTKNEADLKLGDYAKKTDLEAYTKTNDLGDLATMDESDLGLKELAKMTKADLNLGALASKSTVAETDLESALATKINGKANVYIQKGEPANMNAGDLWIQIVD